MATAIPYWPPKRERPPVPEDLRSALLDYQSAADHFAAHESMGAWDKLKVAYRLWRTAEAASKALHRHRDVLRYVFMTAFDRGRMLGSEPKRTAILNHAVDVLGLVHAIGPDVHETGVAR